ncbi:DUF6573 family protein [Ereboglobus luteus]|uniref:Uncharacterized protein n=1 Tax=Ereboglobus luteus TaxID=1796921 RepID=A0A2U8E0E2_9BACT|nr:DUF6573 family protein [Ereboglobus luteus]AWI08327.1 hypothetical protein CKA38_02800 [Ereboglobus luteus]
MIANDNGPFGGVIYSYTRKQAINDGVLVDLSNYEVVKQHWKLPIACTDTLWQTIEAAMRQDDSQDISGILHDISTMAKLQIRGADTSDVVLFDVKLGKETHKLKLHMGPGDTPDQVLTLMFSDED